jgi:hypothetical protein
LYHIRRLNIISDESFQKVIEKLPQEHAQTLIKKREHDKEIKQAQEKTREQTHDLSRSR